MTARWFGLTPSGIKLSSSSSTCDGLSARNRFGLPCLLDGLLERTDVREWVSGWKGSGLSIMTTNVLRTWTGQLEQRIDRADALRQQMYSDREQAVKQACQP